MIAIGDSSSVSLSGCSFLGAFLAHLFLSFLIATAIHSLWVNSVNSILLVFQSIQGLFSLSHGNPRIRSFFPMLVTKSFVPILRLSKRISM